MVADLDLFGVVKVHKTRKGLVCLTRKGTVQLTRKGLVSDVLNSPIDLSFYALFARKNILCLLGLVSVLTTNPFA